MRIIFALLLVLCAALPAAAQDEHDFMVRWAEFLMQTKMVTKPSTSEEIKKLCITADNFRQEAKKLGLISQPAVQRPLMYLLETYKCPAYKDALLPHHSGEVLFFIDTFIRVG
jgi:hypothetical protein